MCVVVCCCGVWRVQLNPNSDSHAQVQQPSSTREVLDARLQTSVGSVKATVIVMLTAKVASSAFSERHQARQYLAVKPAAT